MWDTAVITKAGAALLEQWASGGTLTIDEVKTGAGKVPAGSAAEATGITDEKQTPDITRWTKLNSGIQCEIVLNAAETGYVCHQIGIFAHLDSGDKTLMALYQDETGIDIPASADMPEFQYTFLSVLALDNTGEIVVNVNPTLYVTPEDMEQELEKYVPTTRTINNHELSQDVTLTAEDIQAVPVERTINTHPLSEDVTLTANDVGAVASVWGATPDETGDAKPEVGGRNYVKNGNFDTMNGWKVRTESQHGQDFSSEIISEDGKSWAHLSGYGKDNDTNVNETICGIVTVSASDIGLGKKSFTLSAIVKAKEEGQKGYVHIRAGSYPSNAYVQDSCFGFSVPTTPTRISHSWKLRDGARYVTFGFNTNPTFFKEEPFDRNVNDTNDYYVTDVKVEDGEVPTDWSPAPEDLVPATRTINGKNLGDDISLTPSDIGAVGSVWGVKADGSGNAKPQIGGVNLLSNSKTFAGWGNSGTTSEDGEPILDNFQELHSPLEFKISDFPEADLVVSFDAKTEAPKINFGIIISIKHKDEQSRYTYVSVNTGNTTPKTNGWNRYFIPFNMKTDVLDKADKKDEERDTDIFDIAVRVTGSGTPATFRLVKFERGVVPTDWSPAPEDMVPATRKINGKALGTDMTLTTADIGITSSTVDLEDGVSPLETGKIYLVYSEGE